MSKIYFLIFRLIEMLLLYTKCNYLSFLKLVLVEFVVTGSAQKLRISCLCISKKMKMEN